MKSIASWISRHQVIAFFVLTFGITFGLGFSFDAVMKRGQFVLAPLATTALCGPALAGIIITVVSNRQPKRAQRRAPWIAFLVLWGVSMVVFVANSTFINNVPLSPEVTVLSAVAVLPVALAIGAAYSRNPAVRTYVASLLRMRGVWAWYLLALTLLPGLALLSIPISSAIGRQPIAAHHFPTTGLAAIGWIAVTFAYQLFFFNATGEEVGWRGFALPRLQARTSPLIASLILAFPWVLWHLPLWQAEGRPNLDLQYCAEAHVGLVPATLVITWIFNRAKGSILVPGITHAAGNTALGFLPNLDWQVFTVTVPVAALVMIFTDRMWARSPGRYYVYAGASGAIADEGA